MTKEVELAPDLQTFAEVLVAEGRYEDIDAVVEAALNLLRSQEDRRRQFGAMLEKVEAEIERGEVVTSEEMMAEIDAIIAAAEIEAAE